MKFNIEITFSKILAFLIIVLAFILDVRSDTKGTIFMFAIPFVGILIGVKQHNDRKNNEIESK